MLSVCFRRLRFPAIFLVASLTGHIVLAKTGQPTESAPLTFSFLEKIIGAFTALVISGVGGALFQRWLARAMPRFEITSIGFTGTPNLIRIDDELLSLSIRDNWGPTLRRYEPYDELMERDRAAAETAERLKKALALAEEWLDKYRPTNPKPENPICVDFNEINKYPISQEPIIGNIWRGLCRTNEIGEIPYPLEAVRRLPRLAELTKNDKKETWCLSLGKFAIMFPFKDVDGEARLGDIELLAESFARGIRENLVHYTKRVVDASTNDLLALAQLREKLAQTLVPEAHLCVIASFYNSGSSAATIRPHMALRILHDRLKDEAFIMSNTRTDKKEEAVGLLLKLIDANGANKPRGKHVVVEGILPETSTAPYVTVAPGQACEVRLVATEPLGKENGEKLRAIYNAGILKCQMVCQTVAGNRIWSTPTDFSIGVSQESRQNLKKILSKSKP